LIRVVGGIGNGLEIGTAGIAAEPTVPVTVSVGFQSWSLGTSFMVNSKGLWIILMFVVTTLPAASVAVKVNSFVPPLKGRFSAKKLPPHSISILIAFAFQNRGQAGYHRRDRISAARRKSIRCLSKS
jgi:hypothetical protein